jgi:glycine/D-amino acid oxidase-like deaminating enzyme
MTSPWQQADVCIVGAGVMGASAAWQLARHGSDVLILDRSVPGSEASGATAGTLAIQNKKLAAIPVVLQALEMWRTLSEQLGADVEYDVRGGLRVAHTAEDVEKLERAVRDQRALGVDVEMIYPPQLQGLAPYLGPGVQAASYCARDGMANPFATVRAFLRAARRAGARLESGCTVTAAESDAGHGFLVRTSKGSVRCRILLGAAGAWTSDLARMLGVDLPVHTELLQALITNFGPPVFPHVVTHVRGNLTLKQQRRSGKILIGGAWPGEGSRESGRKLVRRDSLVGNLRWAVETIPAIAGTELLRSWVGFEGRTPDRMLICGPIGPPGFHVLGCSAGGFTLSPLAGRLAAERILSGGPSLEYRALEAQRFADQASGRAAG